jgi:biopolymer transport protein ExbD
MIEEKEANFGLQMAPMINVMLVMLAVFVAAAGIIQTEKWLRVPPLPDGKSNLFKQPVIIEISDRGEVSLNGAVVAMADDDGVGQLELRLSRLVQLLPDQLVVIRPHADTIHQRVVDVVDACKTAGVTKFSFGEKT